MPAILDTIKSNWDLPVFDRSKSDDPDSVRAHEGRLREARNRRVDLIARFHRVAPEHPMARELMMKRWAAMMDRHLADRRDELITEVNRIAGEEGNPLRVDAACFKAILGFSSAREGGADAVLGPIEAFITLAPEDERGAQLLSMVARLPKTPPDRRAAILGRILARYPDSETARTLEASRRRAEGIGKPFELTFRDAISGKMVSLQKDSRGKVVVIGFWATWCGPCVAEMPRMEQLYSRYKDKGVEFIGVSLDAPDEEGLKALTTFVKETGVAWPQFHGEASNEFARRWGVTAISAVFVVHPQGNLHTTDGRGQLDSLIPELLR